VSNIYYDPNDFGLEIFEHIEDDNACYSFDDFIIWRRLEDGKLFFGQDSGCSCPSPFEYYGVNDLTPITDLQQLEIAIDSYRGSVPEYQRCTSDRKQEVVQKVKKYWDERGLVKP
jgi:hypothetical protein